MMIDGQLKLGEARVRIGEPVVNEPANLITVFGGQMGSEGKGQICQFLHEQNPFDIGVRVGGPNAGHTLFAYGVDGERHKVVVQSMPAAAMTGAIGVIGPAGVFIVSLLLQELVVAMQLTGKPAQLIIDPRAAIITPEMMAAEEHLGAAIGSTREGVGKATALKVMREPITVYQNMDKLAPIFNDPAGAAVAIQDTVPYVNQCLLQGRRVVIEGTQGYGLSLHTSGFYPFCTSRECTPHALYAETGINPRNAKYGAREIMVVRTYPIRVGGNSGPLANEISWDRLQEITDGYVKTPEITTVTKKVRRIARMDFELLERAVLQTRPTSIALTFLDYVFPKIAGLNPFQDLPDSPEVAEYLTSLEQTLGVHISMVSTAQDITIDTGERL